MEEEKRNRGKIVKTAKNQENWFHVSVAARAKGSGVLPKCP